MRQRPKPVKSKAKAPVARKSPRDENATVRDLEKRLGEALARDKTSEILRDRELVEAHEQQTATSEILASSAVPKDAQAVFARSQSGTVCHATTGGVCA
jgi:hypothetical protein